MLYAARRQFKMDYTTIWWQQYFFSEVKYNSVLHKDTFISKYRNI